MSRDSDEVEPYTDGWGNTAHSGTGHSDHVCRPVLLDAEGKERPIIRYSSGYKTEGCVMKAESDGEPISHAAPVVRLVKDYADRTDEPIVDLKRDAQRGSAYNSPEREKVSIPGTRGSAPFSPNWHTRPNSAGNDGIGNTKLYGDYIIRNRDKESKVYAQLPKGANPIINNNEDIYYESLTAPSHQLSKPTNDIGSAVVVVEGDAIEPNYESPLILNQIGMYFGKRAPQKQLFTVPRPPQVMYPPSGTIGSQQAAKIYGYQHETINQNKIDNYRVLANPLNNREGNQNGNGNRSAMYFGNRAPYPAPSEPHLQRRLVASPLIKPGH